VLPEIASIFTNQMKFLAEREIIIATITIDKK
jgi:hypothetical protein